jgi:hypothetical protein
MNAHAMAAEAAYNDIEGAADAAEAAAKKAAGNIAQGLDRTPRGGEGLRQAHRQIRGNRAIPQAGPAEDHQRLAVLKAGPKSKTVQELDGSHLQIGHGDRFGSHPKKIF